MAKAVAVEDAQSTGMERFKSQPQKLMDFLKDVRSEMRKVVTPTLPEVQSTTAIVIVTVFVFAGYFYVIDTIFGTGLTKLITYFATR